jgi:hypothetical protein
MDSGVIWVDKLELVIDPTMIILLLKQLDTLSDTGDSDYNEPDEEAETDAPPIVTRFESETINSQEEGDAEGPTEMAEMLALTDAEACDDSCFAELRRPASRRLANRRRATAKRPHHQKATTGIDANTYDEMDAEADNDVVLPLWARVEEALRKIKHRAHKRCGTCNSMAGNILRQTFTQKEKASRLCRGHFRGPTLSDITRNVSWSQQEIVKLARMSVLAVCEGQLYKHLRVRGNARRAKPCVLLGC